MGRIVTKVCGLLLLGVVLGACNEPRYLNRPLSSWIHDLNSEQDYKRRKGCEAITAMGPQAERAIPRLIELLEDINEGVQDFAEEALAAVGPAALPALEETLKRSEPALKLHAAAALIQIDVKHAKAADVLVKAVTGVGNAELAKRAQEVVVRRGADAVPLLLPFLKDPYKPVRMQVLRTLQKIGPKAKEATAAVTEAVKDPETAVRRQALKTLAVIGSREQIEPTLRSYLEDETEEVAVQAAMMLKYIGARKSASGYEGEKR